MASFTTRQVLFPDRSASASRLADAVRSRSSRFEALGVTGASRLGAFLVHEMLARIAHLDEAKAFQIASGLADDVLLRSGEAGIFWRTEWSDAGKALEFAELYRAVLERSKVAAKIDQDGPRVTVVLGQVDRGKELVDLLPSASS